MSTYSAAITHVNRISIRMATPVLLLAVAAVAYSILPVLVKRWTFPPGNDVQYLQGLIDSFPSAFRYYGHLPALVLGMSLYYWLTPIFVAMALWYALRQYGEWTPLVAWLALWVIGRPLLFDMSSGTFIGVIGFYALTLSLWRYLSGKPSGWAVWTLTPALVLFHTFSGMLAMTGMGLWGILNGKRTFWLMLPGAAVAWFTGQFFDASSKLVLTVGQPQWTTSMNAPEFVRTYSQLPMIAFVWFAGVLLFLAWRKGYRPTKDSFFLMMWALVPVLIVLTFTFLQINSDRTAKILTSIILITSSVGIVASVRYMQSTALSVMAGAFIGVNAIIGAMGSLPFWLASGIR